MGRDISPIGNHNLNTDNVKKLAEDLVSRLDINIEYGYVQDITLSLLMGVEEESKFVTIDKIIKHKSFDTYDTYRLTDESFELKLLYDKYGDELFYNEDYWSKIGFEESPDEKSILEEKEEIEFPRYCLEFYDGRWGGFININKENYRNHLRYLMGWWDLCRFFTKKYYKDEDPLKYLNNYRKELMDHTLKIGGDKIYYLDDQSKVLQGVGFGNEAYMTWVDFENFVYEKTSHLMLDIPKFMTDNDYREAFHKLNEYPLSFIDNFEDLK